jgi:hypothetical protein
VGSGDDATRGWHWGVELEGRGGTPAMERRWQLGSSFRRPRVVAGKRQHITTRNLEMFGGYN